MTNNYIGIDSDDLKNSLLKIQEVCDYISFNDKFNCNDCPFDIICKYGEFSRIDDNVLEFIDNAIEKMNEKIRNDNLTF